MGKVKSHTPKLTKKFYPLVSVCTPTFNRRPFIPIMLKCFLNQDYPMDRMEWIIVDDGTDCIRDLIDRANIPQIRYFREEKKMALGEKRNYMHSKAKGTIIVYMDDDDYYPPERVSHAVDTLTKNKDALCVGSSEIYVYFKHIHKMYQSGPYSPTHATAGTFAFRTELLKTNKYEDHAALAEEKHFLNNYTVPFAQLDPLKTILVFSHEHNTFDKRKLLDNQHPDFFRESNKTVSMFIRQEKEADIKKFFLKDIDDLLKVYEPGEPQNEARCVGANKGNRSRTY
jgi:glycosyltransferase involved in cell wall biosynthesis